MPSAILAFVAITGVVIKVLAFLVGLAGITIAALLVGVTARTFHYAHVLLAAFVPFQAQIKTKGLALLLAAALSYPGQDLYEYMADDVVAHGCSGSPRAPQ